MFCSSFGRKLWEINVIFRCSAFVCLRQKWTESFFSHSLRTLGTINESKETVQTNQKFYDVCTFHGTNKTFIQSERQTNYWKTCLPIGWRLQKDRNVAFAFDGRRQSNSNAASSLLTWSRSTCMLSDYHYLWIGERATCQKLSWWQQRWKKRRFGENKLRHRTFIVAACSILML